MGQSESGNYRHESRALFALCNPPPPEQARLFQTLLQRQLDSIEENLSPSADARDFIERTVAVIQDFILVVKID
jgi:hypothetical protein